MAEKFATHTDNTGLGNIQFKELVNLIQSLPPMTRTVWNLFVFDGYSHNQIAEELDITTGTSSWHIHQARSILQKKVKQLNSENPLYEDRRI
jgi:RNA polymerase sigma-70 factor (ECF subfamily)